MGCDVQVIVPNYSLLRFEFDDVLVQGELHYSILDVWHAFDDEVA